MSPEDLKASDKIVLTRWEMEKEREHAVIKEKLTQMDSVIPRVYSTLELLERKIAEIPMEIVSCRDRMDKSLKEYMHDEFVTVSELNQFETKLEKKISENMNGMRQDLNGIRTMVWKATWILSGFISAGIFILWILSNTNVVVQ